MLKRPIFQPSMMVPMPDLEAPPRESSRLELVVDIALVVAVVLICAVAFYFLIRYGV